LTLQFFDVDQHAERCLQDCVWLKREGFAPSGFCLSLSLSLQRFRRSPPSVPSRLPWLRCLRWAALFLVCGLVLGSVRLHLRPRLFRLLLKFPNSQFVIVIAAHKQLPTDSA